MLMQGSINVEFSVSSTAILLAWYSVIQTYFMVGNSLQLCWQKDMKNDTWFRNLFPRSYHPTYFLQLFVFINLFSAWI
jgi:hypothetical protein